MPVAPGGYKEFGSRKRWGCADCCGQVTNRQTEGRAARPVSPACFHDWFVSSRRVLPAGLRNCACPESVRARRPSNAYAASSCRSTTGGLRWRPAQCKGCPSGSRQAPLLAEILNSRPGGPETTRCTAGEHHDYRAARPFAPVGAATSVIGLRLPSLPTLKPLTPARLEVPMEAKT
jgi:hypothetical protein